MKKFALNDQKFFIFFISLLLTINLSGEIKVLNKSNNEITYENLQEVINEIKNDQVKELTIVDEITKNMHNITKKGRLEVICGSMFSGKTEELMRRLKRAEYAKQNVLTIKHHIDDRRGTTSISTHDGKKRLAFNINNKKQSIEKILELAKKDIHIIGIDEINFFPEDIIDVILKLVDNGKRVIVSGLELNFRGEPFNKVMTELLAYADEVTKLKAICVVCGKDAHYSQRIINGQPAKYYDPLVLVAAKECYEARCRDCFEMEKPSQPTSHVVQISKPNK